MRFADEYEDMINDRTEVEDDFSIGFLIFIFEQE